MDIKAIIKSQYHAALEMLQQAIVKCPDSTWADPAYKNKFWHIAYHALFYTHLYLQPSEKEFVPWARHREQYEFMESEIGQPYSKEELLEYLALCRQEVEDKAASLNLEAESGFDWLPMGKLELQFYNIRHLQQHTGELAERLGTTANIEVGWVGRRPTSSV
jgi:hypothetical protein